MLVVRRLGASALAILAVLVLAELVLRLLPFQAGLAAADPVLGWPAHRRSYLSSTGWAMDNVQHGRINNVGRFASFDYRDGADFGVVFGDSFIEGYMKPYPALLQAQLAQRLGLPPEGLYNFGTSGAALPHYLGLAQLVGQHYCPRWAVFVINANDFTEGFQRTPGSSPGDARRPRTGGSRAAPRGRGQTAPPARADALRPRQSGLEPQDAVRVGLSAGRQAVLFWGDAVGERPGADRRVAGATRPRLHLPPSRVVLVMNSDRRRSHGCSPPMSPRSARRAVARLSSPPSRFGRSATVTTMTRSPPGRPPPGEWPYASAPP